MKDYGGVAQMVARENHSLKVSVFKSTPRYKTEMFFPYIFGDFWIYSELCEEGRLLIQPPSLLLTKTSKIMEKNIAHFPTSRFLFIAIVSPVQPLMAIAFTRLLPNKHFLFSLYKDIRSSS